MGGVYEVPAAAELREGLRVTWLYVPRGGWGYTRPVPATVAKVGPRRVQVEALKADGSTALRWVRRESLRIRRTA